MPDSDPATLCIKVQMLKLLIHKIMDITPITAHALITYYIIKTSMCMILNSKFQ